jgi:hypothetical protein
VYVACNWKSGLKGVHPRGKQDDRDMEERTT